MNKKYMTFGLLGLFAIALVSAGYLVDSLHLNVGVDESYTVEYAILGDGGDYDPAVDGTCAMNNEWVASDDTIIPGGSMYPAESRKFCVKVDNAGESANTYTVTSSVVTGNSNYADCAIAFPETSLTGTVDGEGTTIDGEAFTVPGDAPEVSGCEIEISVLRG